MAQNIFKSLGFPLEQAAVAEENSREAGGGGGGPAAYTSEVLLQLTGSGNVIDPDVEFSFITLAASCSATMGNGTTDGQPKTIIVQYNGSAVRNLDIAGSFMDTPTDNGGIPGDSVRFKSLDDISTWSSNILHGAGSYRWSTEAGAWIKTGQRLAGGSINYPS